jgi:hypothetical protein
VAGLLQCYPPETASAGAVSVGSPGPFGEVHMRIIIRIFDTDPRRAQRAETLLYANMRANGITGQVHQVFEPLEFSRLGLKGLPALELNGMVLCQERPLTEELLADLCLRLVKAQKKMEGKKTTETDNNLFKKHD